MREAANPIILYLKLIKILKILKYVSRIVDEKSEDGHSNSTDSGIQSVEESSHGSQDKLR